MPNSDTAGRGFNQTWRTRHTAQNAIRCCTSVVSVIEAGSILRLLQPAANGAHWNRFCGDQG